MKRVAIGISFLLSAVALASPITVDVISAPQGLQIQNKAAKLNISQGANVTEDILTQTGADSVKNKTFDESSNVTRLFKFTYDAASMNGATGGITVMKAGFPANTIIEKVWYDVVTPAVQSAGSPNLTVTVSCQGLGDILNAQSLSNFQQNGGVFAAIPDGTIGNKIKMAQAQDCNLTLNTGSITAGKFNFWFTYKTDI